MALWDIVLGPVLKIIDKVVPDKAASQVVKDQITQAAAAGSLQEEILQLQAITSNQSDINKLEAASPSLFVAGGRPGAMWVCVAALAYQYLLKPIVTGIALIVGHPIPAPGLPGLDDSLNQLLWALLGLGAYRSFDKLKGVDTKGVSLK